MAFTQDIEGFATALVRSMRKEQELARKMARMKPKTK